MPQLDEIFQGIPPITRYYLIAAIVLMCLCTVDLISPFHLYLNWNLVLHQYEIWRLASCFFFFGDLGLHFFWNLYMLMFYCGNLEDEAFRGRPADFCWFLLTSGVLILAMSYAAGYGIFFGGTMLNVMTYLWSRKNPHARMGIFFFSIEAPYLPWVLCALSVLVGWGAADHIYGIAAGHIYYFFEEVYPLMPTSNNFRLFKTPKILRWALNQKDEDR